MACALSRARKRRPFTFFPRKRFHELLVGRAHLFFLLVSVRSLMFTWMKYVFWVHGVGLKVLAEKVGVNCAQSCARWSRRRPFSERDDVDVERAVDWVHVIVGIHAPAKHFGGPRAHSVL